MDIISSMEAMTAGSFTQQSAAPCCSSFSSSQSYSSREPMAKPYMPTPGRSLLRALVSFPALQRSRYASEQSSVCMPRSRISESAIMLPRIFGMPPIPSWSVAPSGMWGRMSRAIRPSVSVGAGTGSCMSGLQPASTIASA